MNRVLVTGASGFIGRATLALLLGQGYEVHAITSRQPIELLPGVQWHTQNLLISEQTAQLITNVKPSHLLHFAWYAEPSRYWTSSLNLTWVQASLQLFQLFVEHGGERLVVAGTCAEYDWNYGFCSEIVTPTVPATLYGVAKNSLQLLLAAFAKQVNLSSAWGRIFWLYGPHEHPARLVSSVCSNLLRNQFARVSHGNQIRDFLHVTDVARAFVALLSSQVTGVVNIASGQPVKVKELVCKIAELTNQLHLVQLGVLPTPPDEIPLLVGDNRRLTQEVGWQPIYNLESGLTQTLEFWKTILEEKA